MNTPNQDLLWRAVEKLRNPDPAECCNPYRCAAARAVDRTTADLLERIYVMPAVAVMPSVREFAEAVARAVLRETSDGGEAGSEATPNSDLQNAPEGSA